MVRGGIMGWETGEEKVEYEEKKTIYASDLQLEHSERFSAPNEMWNWSNRSIFRKNLLLKIQRKKSTSSRVKCARAAHLQTSTVEPICFPARKDTKIE